MNEPTPKERIIATADKLLGQFSGDADAKDFIRAVRDEFQRQVDFDRARAAAVKP